MIIQESRGFECVKSQHQATIAGYMQTFHHKHGKIRAFSIIDANQAVKVATHMYSLTSEPFKLERDVEAITVPTGETIELPAGVVGYITQALGGSFTIFVDGSMFMILGHNADALGREPIPAPELPENATQEDVEQAVWHQLSTVYDPEIPVSIVELGLVYECEVKPTDEGYNVDIDMTLTAPGCGMGDVLVSDAATKIKLIPEINQVNCQIVFDPPWDQSMMSEEAKLETGML